MYPQRDILSYPQLTQRQEELARNHEELVRRHEALLTALSKMPIAKHPEISHFLQSATAALPATAEAPRPRTPSPSIPSYQPPTELPSSSPMQSPMLPPSYVVQPNSPLAILNNLEAEAGITADTAAKIQSLQHYPYTEPLYESTNPLYQKIQDMKKKVQKTGQLSSTEKLIFKTYCDVIKTQLKVLKSHQNRSGQK